MVVDYFCVQVHDELVFEVPEAELETVCAQIKAEMEAVATFSIPLEVSVGSADNWAEAH